MMLKQSNKKMIFEKSLRDPLLVAQIDNKEISHSNVQADPPTPPGLGPFKEFFSGALSAKFGKSTLPYYQMYCVTSPKIS